MRGPLVVVMAAALAATAACADPSGPEALVPPTLRALSIGAGLALPSAHGYGGLVTVRAWPVDTSFRLQRGQRLPLEVAVSSGDRETVGLYRRYCPARDRGIGYPCFRFQVFMESGRSPHDVAERVAAIGGRFDLVSSNFAGVTVFHPEVVQAARRAARWPGVASTALMGTGPCPPDVSGCSLRSDLLVPMPVDEGDAVPGDGVLQVRHGDMVTVTYQQPDGRAIQAARMQ